MHARREQYWFAPWRYVQGCDEHICWTYRSSSGNSVSNSSIWSEAWKGACTSALDDKRGAGWGVGCTAHLHIAGFVVVVTVPQPVQSIAQPRDDVSSAPLYTCRDASSERGAGGSVCAWQRVGCDFEP